MTWRACERFGIKPPGVKDNWLDIDPWTVHKILGYEQIRQYEEAEEQINMYKALGMKV